MQTNYKSMGTASYLQKPGNDKQFTKARLLVKVLLAICTITAAAMAVALINSIK